MTEKEAKPAKAKRTIDEQNGVSRPAPGTKTGLAWEIADAQSKKLGEPAPRKSVIDECVAEGINPSTAATQYGRWRKYHGLEGRGGSAKRTEAPAKKKAAASKAKGTVEKD